MRKIIKKLIKNTKKRVKKLEKMADNEQLLSAILHEYLVRKDKTLAQVFQHKTKAVSLIIYTHNYGSIRK